WSGTRCGRRWTSYAVPASTTRPAASSTARRTLGHPVWPHPPPPLMHDEQVRAVTGRCAAAGALLFGALAAMLARAPAHAECGLVMTYQLNPAAAGAEFSPRSVTVDAGGCVSLSNNTLFTAQFTVGRTFHA